MRKILFRGKRTDNKEWVEGFYYEHEPPLVGLAPPGYVAPENTVFIARTGFADWNMPRPVQLCNVIPETVGQYTGLSDKNGKRIFEGDICRNTKTGEIVSVKWHGTMAGYVWSRPKENGSALFDFGELFRAFDKYEVIGNIYDNPGLLEGKT